MLYDAVCLQPQPIHPPCTLYDAIMSASPNVPKEYLTTRGAVLLLSVFDYDRLKWDDFAGEVAVHLSHLAPLSMDRSVDRMPVIMMPLKRPTADRQGPFSVSGGMHAAFLLVCVESCEHSRFCVEVFVRHNYSFSLIHSFIQSQCLVALSWRWYCLKCM